MKLLPSTKIHDLIETYPFLLDFLAEYRPKFSILKNKAMQATMGRMATLSIVASIGDVSLTTLLKDIAEEIKRETGEEIEFAVLSTPGKDREKLDELKKIIIDLHAGVEFSEVKKRFDRLMAEIEPTQIAKMEEELIRDGMPSEEIQRLCDLHVSVFKDSLEKQEPVEAPPGHPVHTMMAENTEFSGVIRELDTLVQKLADSSNQEKFRGLKPGFDTVLSKMAELNKHYIRKENQLFPFLEKHDFTGPSKVMWGIHDEIRKMLKDLRNAVENDDTASVIELGPKLSRTIVEMIYKENTILFPTAIDILSEEEWIEIRKGEDEIGYAFVTPGTEWPPEAMDIAKDVGKEGKSAAFLNLDTGSLSPEQVNLLFTHLPIEISFIDEHDEMRYYSDTPERVFPRSPGVIGRKVQNCHPPKSVQIVNSILEAFRAGTKDSAEFWIEMEGRMILIRYFAVRGREGTYIGTIEVTQDITRIRELKGERRLLDWDDEIR